MLFNIYTKQQNHLVSSFPVWVHKSPIRLIMVSIPSRYFLFITAFQVYLAPHLAQRKNMLLYDDCKSHSSPPPPSPKSVQINSCFIFIFSGCPIGWSCVINENSAQNNEAEFDYGFLKGFHFLSVWKTTRLNTDKLLGSMTSNEAGINLYNAHF